MNITSVIFLRMSSPKKNTKIAINENILMFSKTVPSAPNVEITGALDHNNFVKAVLSKEKTTLPTKLRKSTKAPQFRRFPGSLRESRRESPIGAIYAEELAGEDKGEKNIIIPKDELMLQPDFLKLDQSKLPVDLFDDLDYSANDKSPEEWLKICNSGSTPFFIDGKWHWREVTILAYNSLSRKYTIKFGDDGITKEVSRLNLRFDAENAAEFDKRRAIAESGRSEAKQLMRFDHFVLAQSKDLIRAIGKDGIRKIHERVIDGLPVDIPFPDQGTPLGYLLRNCTAELIQWYSLIMKKIVVYSQIEGVKLKAEVVSRYQQLNLPKPPAKPAVPRIGKVACPEYPYDERQSRMSHIYISSQREVQYVVLYCSIVILLAIVHCAVVYFKLFTTPLLKKTLCTLNLPFDLVNNCLSSIGSSSI